MLSTQLVLAKEVLGDANVRPAYDGVRRWMRGDHEAAALQASAMMASASGAASSRESSPASAAALPAAPIMAEVSEGVGPRLCQAAGQRIMYYGTQCVPWLRIRREGLSGTHIELCADEPPALRHAYRSLEGCVDSFDGARGMQTVSKLGLASG